MRFVWNTGHKGTELEETWTKSLKTFAICWNNSNNDFFNLSLLFLNIEYNGCKYTTFFSRKFQINFFV